MFETLVRPVLEYSSSAGASYTQADILNIEAVHRLSHLLRTILLTTLLSEASEEK